MLKLMLIFFNSNIIFFIISVTFSSLVTVMVIVLRPRRPILEKRNSEKIFWDFKLNATVDFYSMHVYHFS